jgi:hypothetical protein
MYNKFVFGGKIPCPFGDLKFSQDTKWNAFLVNF